MKFTKTLMTLAIAGLLFTACKEKDAEAPAEGKTTTAAVASEKAAVVGKVETASFHIEGMTCAVGCAKTLESKLAEMDGVQKATVDFEKKLATVEYDNAKQTPEKFVKTVESAVDGKTYKVSDLKTTADHAMLMTGDPVKKAKTATKKSKKGSTKTDKKDCGTATKGGCRSGKKHCSEEKTM